MSGFTDSLDHFFRISERGSTIPQEVKGGIITFLSMVYILSVNPSIVTIGAGASVSWDALFTSTALAAIISCLLMGLYARFPIALAPGMGINAFLSFTVCIAMGFNYPQALMAVFLSGVLFFILTITGARAKLIESFPAVLRYSFTAGIGFFIAIVGLFNAGIIEHGSGSALMLGDLSDGTVLLGLFAIVLTLVLWFRNKWGAVLIGIIVTTAIGIVTGLIPLPSSVVANPDFSLIGAFANAFDGFPTEKTVPFLAAILALAIMDMFDTTGTILAVIERTKDKDVTDIELTDKAMAVDSVATMAGAVFGTTTTTAFIESCTGIESGARTGLTAVVTAIMFAIAMFFAPVFGVVTNACLVGALVLVGILMISAVKNIDWKDGIETATGFVTIFMIGLSGSITDGIAFGTLMYIVGMCATGNVKKINKIMWVLGAIFLLYFVVYYGYIMHI